LPDRTIDALGYALTLINQSASLGEAQRKVQQAIRAAEVRPLEGTTGPARMRGRSFFDRLMDAILEKVKQAVSREELVKFTLESLADDENACAGLCYFCLDADIGLNGDLSGLTISASALIHERRLANFVANRLPGLATSKLILDVLVDRLTLEFLPTEHLAASGYRNDFAELVASAADRLWLCALPLPAADANHSARMLVALYPVTGSIDAPSLPRGATLEWRVMSFLRVAYEMLNHQLSSTRELVLRQRRELLADLAPGIVNHEINQQINAFAEAIKLMIWGAHGLDAIIPQGNTDFEALLSGLRTVRDAADRLRAIADAFNNLERRPDSAPVPVDKLISEVVELQSYTLARHGIALDLQKSGFIEIRADAALLEHVLLNIVANAVEAISGDVNNAANPIIRLRVTRDGDDLAIVVMNNGAPIRLARPDRIFEKGFTTKPRGVGHGLGLHMCRMVMTYIGGSINLIPSDRLDGDMKVGFRIALPLGGNVAGDILGT
jgi:signal transduction histidine kinase